MECDEIVFSGHAVQRMFERQISQSDVRVVVATGEKVADYPDDRPFPSRLLLGFVRGHPVHVVAAQDLTGGRCYVVTVYVPGLAQWEPDFRTRKMP